MRLVILLCLLVTAAFSQKAYQKIYFENGEIKEEGWINNGQKHAFWKYYYQNGTLRMKGHYENDQRTKYWFFYHKNGKKESEGHYVNNKKNNWWISYDNAGKAQVKSQYLNDYKEGISLVYVRKKITKAIKYSRGKKIKEWTDLKSFRKEHKLSDFQ